METLVRVVPIGGFLLCGLLGVRLLMLQHKLFEYLRENHFEKWKELTTILGFGPGYANGFRGIPFLYSKDDLGDPEVRWLKVKVRNSFALVLLTMLGTFLTFVVLVGLSQQSAN